MLQHTVALEPTGGLKQERNMMGTPKQDNKPLSFSDWIHERASDLDCEAAETGMDRELDFDREAWEDKKYEAYLEEINILRSRENVDLPAPTDKASRLRCATYMRGRAEAYLDSEPDTRTAFRFGRTTYRCNATPEAVTALADRIEANRFRHGCTRGEGINIPVPKASKVKPHTFNSPQKAFNDFCQSGEIGNALTYAALVNLPVYFANCSSHPEVIVGAKEFVPGFVVGKIYNTSKKEVAHPWVVTHLGTGLKAGSSLNNKTAKQAIAEFNKIPKEKFEKALEDNKYSLVFQITGAKFYQHENK